MIRTKGYERAFKPRPVRPLKRKVVDDALLAIWREFEARLPSAYAADQKFGLSKNEDAKNFLRREVYALGRALQNSPPKWDVAELVASSRVHRTTRIEALEGRVFHALLMGVYHEDSLIKRQERWSMAKELEYADRHDVPPEHLCGFLYQSGGRSNLLKKLAAGYREPAFRK